MYSSDRSSNFPFLWEIRNRAVGMLVAGITQKKVAKDVGI